MIENPFYSPEIHGAYEEFELGDLVLEEGQTLRGAKLAYKTYGELNDAKDNAILVTTWFSGTHLTMNDVYIGEGHALDPAKYFIIVINQIGNGLSSSPHNSDGPAAMGGFPHVRIGDDVRAQEQLLRERFGIEQLALVVGGSMGAQQTYEWAVRFPDKVKRAAPIAGTAQVTPHDVLYVQTLIEAITSDPNWRDGWYSDAAEVRGGLARHARIWSVLGLSTEFWKQEAWRSAGFSSAEDFHTSFVQAYFAVLDPNSLLTMAWKWQRGDVARLADGDLAATLERIKAKVFVMPIDEDMFFPPRDCAAEEAMIPNSELRVISAISGHFGLFGLEPEFMEQVDGHLSELLAAPA